MVYCKAGPGDHPEADDEQWNTLAYGSAFIYELDGNTYLVTARHNLTGRHWQTNACLGGYPVPPTHIKVVFLAKPPSEGWRLTPLETNPRVASTQFLAKAFATAVVGEDWQPLWKEHPEFGSGMDVAVLPINITDDDLLITAWNSPRATPPLPSDARWPDLAPGHDVFVVGYPDALSTGPLFPLWIRGTIASEPHFGHTVDGRILPLMLVDARTRKGQSGSAVIRTMPVGLFVQRVDGNPAVIQSAQSQIIGVYSGRTSDESDLGYVWRMDEVDAICTNGVPGTA